MEGMTPGNATQRKKGALTCSIAIDGFEGIGRTGWRVDAMLAKKG